MWNPLRDVSLAPLRYRNVMEEEGGPISRLSTHRREVEDGQGAAWFDTCAYLRNDLGFDRSRRDSPQLYSDVDGAGCARLEAESKFKAVSEALERWAFWEIAGSNSSKLLAEFGFDREPSTTGLAAFPGVSAAPARERARWEAIERWSLAAFWEGKVAIEKVPLGFRILAPFSDAVVVLLHRRFRGRSGERHAFGFAADRDLARATRRASVELSRNQSALEGFAMRRRASRAALDPADSPPPSNWTVRPVRAEIGGEVIPKWTPGPVRADFGGEAPLTASRTGVRA